MGLAENHFIHICYIIKNIQNSINTSVLVFHKKLFVFIKFSDKKSILCNFFQILKWLLKKKFSGFNKYTFEFIYCMSIFLNT